ncbi:MAG: GWxTD domain-containing protein [Melioribacteraceae bacterium]|nr:GWxTD domain-containing protein [Melioribacteraceae bacterium]
MNFIKQLKPIKSKEILFFICILLSFNILFAQKRIAHKALSKRPPIYFETHLIPSSSLFTCFISFKIPYNNLLFVREGAKFNSELTITYEIFEGDKFISRKFNRKTISIAEYEKTDAEDLFLEGITNFKLSEGEYRILPSILLGNTDIEIKNMSLNLLVDSSQIMKPIVISNSSNCDSSNIKLANFQNRIPFSKDEYDLLIPIYSKDDLLLNVIIKQDEKIITENEITEYELFNNELFECNNQIVLVKNNNSELIKYFRLNFVNKNLIEGNATIFLKSETFELEFDMNVFWNEKPKSLLSLDGAISAMKIIGYKDVADSLLGISDEEQYKALFNFWSKFDDNNTTSFNEIFYEFYSRIDFVRKEFNSLGKNDGLDTDRGRTYLLFGKPDKIERTYSEIYNVLEVWIYNSLNEKIYFSDKTGTGKFERVK